MDENTGNTAMIVEKMQFKEEEEEFIPKRQEKDIISPLIPEGKHPNPC